MGWKNVQYENGKLRTSEGGGGGGSSTFADLEDVNFSNLQNGQVPKYNSNTQKWENANESGGGGTVTDVTVDGVSVVNPQTGVAEIEMPTPPSVPDELSDLSDVQFSNLADHQPLRYNATSQKWENGADSFPPLIYSFEEREIGVWIDGRPLYQKVITFSPMSNSPSKRWYNVADVSSLSINHLVTCVLYNGNYKPWYEYYSEVQDGYLKIYSANDSWGANAALIQYTKTTDTPGSGTWTTQGGYAHHYSTTEHIIGTWIDGKPLYEKMYTFSTAITINTSATTVSGIDTSNMREIIECKAIRTPNTSSSYNRPAVLYPQAVKNANAIDLSWYQSFAGIDKITLQYTKTTD